MPADSLSPDIVLSSVVDRTRQFMATEAGISVTRTTKAAETLERLQLRKFTAIIGVGSNIGALVAFSFPQNLVDILYSRLTAGLTMPPDEEDPCHRSTVTEVANVIIGHCTADFSSHGEHVSISPPVLLEETKYVHRAKDSALRSVSLFTAHGCFDINLIGPSNKYNARLECVNEVQQCSG
jgi:CheY-specific phosphatase CheX